MSCDESWGWYLATVDFEDLGTRTVRVWLLDSMPDKEKRRQVDAAAIVWRNNNVPGTYGYRKIVGEIVKEE